VVQACHASLEAARAFLSTDQPHPFVIVCGLRDERSLAQALDRLRRAGVRCRAFHEEDLGGALTAVATEPLSDPQRGILRDYRLL
jgi:hypothetical protein